MTTPKRLGPEALDSLLRNIGDEAPGIEERLREHIAALEIEHRAFADTVNESAGRIEAKLASMEEQSGTLLLQLTAAAAQLSQAHQHISELEQSLENARKERDEARQRVDSEYAAKMEEARWGAMARAAIEALSGVAESDGEEIGACIDRIIRERDEAVADNAALVRDATAVLDALNDERQRGLNTASTALGLTVYEPHPGAALLEKHRKTLVRARNEGLEKAAAAVGHLMEGQSGGVLVILQMAVKDIRAMKEPGA